MKSLQPTSPLANFDVLLPSQQAIHNNFMQSLFALHRDLVRAAYYLLQVRERHIHRALGFARITEYAEAVAGLSPAQCRSFLELARRLPDFPGVEQALTAGELSWSQARTICRRARPEEQRKWLELAAELSSAELEAGNTHEDSSLSHSPPKLTAPEPGKSASVAMKPKTEKNTPSAPALPASFSIRLRFSLEQYVRWQRLAEAARRMGNLEEAILEGLGGSSSARDGFVPLMVMLTCPACDRASWPTSRGEFNVPRPLLKAGYCDAVVEDAAGNRRRTVNPRLRRLAFQRARYRCEAAGCGCAVFLQVHHIRPVAGAGQNKIENLKVLCWRCHRGVHQEEDAARESIRKGPG